MARKPPTRKWRKKRPGRDPGPLAPGLGDRLRVRQVRSGIGQPAALRRTLAALGLRHHQQVVVHKNHAALRGMLYHVRHLVEVTSAKDGD
ncbi:MAG: 50S ribosomal protein L30 [Gemmatimonadales bacterium]